jgi:hypothetical protein
MRFVAPCLLTVLFLFNVRAQEQTSLTTDTVSSQFATNQEKIAFLERYLKLPTKIEAAEYHIIYHDNSTGRVPGPSDWDMRVVVKVASEDMLTWLESLTATTEPFDINWVYELAKDWKLTSTPRFFTGDKRAVLFEAESVIVWWLSTTQ